MPSDIMYVHDDLSCWGHFVTKVFYGTFHDVIMYAIVDISCNGTYAMGILYAVGTFNDGTFVTSTTIHFKSILKRG